MTAASSTRATVVVAALLGVVLTGCGADSEPPPAPTTNPAGRVLTVQEAEAALPTQESFPVPVKEVRPSEPSTDDLVTDPSQCKDVLFTGSAVKSFHRKNDVARVERTYALEESGSQVTVRVQSSKIEPPADFFDLAGEALVACQNYRVIDEKDPSTWAAQPLGVNVSAERVFAVRLRVTEAPESPAMTELTADLIQTQQGHNTVRVLSVSKVDDDRDDLAAQVANQTLARLGGQDSSP